MSWNRRYFFIIAVLAAIWLAAYWYILPFSTWVVSVPLHLDPTSKLGSSIEFFIYDTVKILLLLVALIYVIAWIRASLNVERVREYLMGKRRGIGYFLGSLFGSVTPFCSCSSIPLFLGFTTARIPFGITMSFLITSPLINEIAVVLLWGLLGWKFTVIYVAVGMLAGIIGGAFMDAINAERWLQPFFLDVMRNPPRQTINERGDVQKMTVSQRHNFAYGEMRTIFSRVWKWVIVGVGIGAALHGFVPDNWFAQHLGAGEGWTVPAAVLVAIPLYSNVTGIVPIMESLLMKGLPIGTTLAFCMSAVAASIPEVMLLRQIMTIKLQAVFITYLWVIFSLVGWLFNFVGPYIVNN
ncbi:MAG: permease [Alistipes senegalensis]|nr:permease [Oxalobacter formigenes]MCM1280979.1 permease [Alistipes senegalensis]